MTPSQSLQHAEDMDRELRDVEADRRGPCVLPEFREAPQLNLEEKSRWQE